MNERQKVAMNHPDKLHLGAMKRRRLSPDEIYEVVMAKFDRKTLWPGSGQKVAKLSQARAIARSEVHRRKMKTLKEGRNETLQT